MPFDGLKFHGFYLRQWDARKIPTYNRDSNGKIKPHYFGLLDIINFGMGSAYKSEVIQFMPIQNSNEFAFFRIGFTHHRSIDEIIKMTDLRGIDHTKLRAVPDSQYLNVIQDDRDFSSKFYPSRDGQILHELWYNPTTHKEDRFEFQYIPSRKIKEDMLDFRGLSEDGSVIKPRIKRGI